MRVLLAAALIAAWPAAGRADIFRWVDANGEVHFSQTPPAHGAYQRVHPDVSSSGVDDGGAAAQNFLDRSAKHDSEAAKAREAALQVKADNAEKCAKARERISFLEEKTAHRIFVKGPDGSRSRMTDEQFDKELQQAREQQAKYCQ
jgi:hypothetical protein